MKAINNFCAVISVDIVVSVDGNLFIGYTIKLSVSVSSLKYHISTALVFTTSISRYTSMCIISHYIANT